MRKATIGVAVIALWIGVAFASDTTAVGSLPKVFILGSLSKVYEPVRLNHAEHISTAGGCADCHHQHGSMQVHACLECHPIDPSVFKKNLNFGKFKSCGSCHPASEGLGSVARRGLKDAYHQACFKCHKTDVGSGVKNLKGCTEMCHVPVAQEKGDGKK